MTDFFLTLPSNVTSPGNTNTVANYTTTFGNAISLNGNWECCIKEIMFPLKWKMPQIDMDWLIHAGYQRQLNVEYPVGNLEITETLPNSIEKFERWRVNMRLQPNKSIPLIQNVVYTSLDLLVVDINDYINGCWFETDSILRSTKKPVVEIDTKRRICVSPGKTAQGYDVYIYFSEGLRAMLGFVDTWEQYRNNEKTVGDLLTWPGDKWRGGITHENKGLVTPYHLIYVFCSAIEPQYIGNAKYQILRAIPITDFSSINFSREFKNSYYIKVMEKEMSSISISFCFDNGDAVKFLSGRSFVVLHFRKII